MKQQLSLGFLLVLSLVSCRISNQVAGTYELRCQAYAHTFILKRNGKCITHYFNLTDSAKSFSKGHWTQKADTILIYPSGLDGEVIYYRFVFQDSLLIDPYKDSTNRISNCDSVYQRKR